MADDNGFTPELDHHLSNLIRPILPMRDCPATWLLEPHIRKDWKTFLWRFRRRSPFLFKFMGYGADFAKDLPRSYIERKIQIISEWINEAKTEFLQSKTGFFWRCRVLDYTERPKHWRPASFSLKRTQQESLKNREGIFFPGTKIELIEEGLLCIFASFYSRARVGRLPFASVLIHRDVGFAYGEPVATIRYDISYTREHAHAYPVRLDEALKHPHVQLELASD